MSGESLNCPKIREFVNLFPKIPEIFFLMSKIPPKILELCSLAYGKTNQKYYPVYSDLDSDGDSWSV